MPFAFAPSIGKFLYLFHVLPTKTCSTFVKFMHKGLVIGLFMSILHVENFNDLLGRLSLSVVKFSGNKVKRSHHFHQQPGTTRVEIKMRALAGPDKVILLYLLTE